MNISAFAASWSKLGLVEQATGLRFAASQFGLARPWHMFQQDLIAWFHTAFVHRLGRYLIDLNSGRLRVGAERYRQLTQEPDRQFAAVVAGDECAPDAGFARDRSW